MRWGPRSLVLLIDPAHVLEDTLERVLILLEQRGIPKVLASLHIGFPTTWPNVAILSKEDAIDAKVSLLLPSLPCRLMDRFVQK